MGKSEKDINGSLEKKPEWKCPYCNYAYNLHRERHCSACGKLRPRYCKNYVQILAGMEEFKAERKWPKVVIPLEIFAILALGTVYFYISRGK